MPTRTATVLFTDLVASVETASRLGPVAAERLRRDHDDLLITVIGRHGGTVVKHLGDGMMAVFDAASHAVTASVAIQHSVHRHNSRSGEPLLSMRIGLSAGDISFASGDCFGAPVSEAARLCAAAAGGQVLASDLVRLTSRGLAGAGFRPVGSLSLKGLPDPVDAVEIVWDPPGETRTPLPDRLLYEGAFVGRTAELAALDPIFERAVSGEGRQVALIHAEPGMGKTALAAQAVVGWHDKGASVALGECDAELSTPYGPVSVALEHLVRHAPGHVLDRVVERHGSALAKLVPSLAARTPDPGVRRSTDPEIERYLGLAAAVDLLCTLADEDPVVLVIEDLHWADAATLTFIRHLAANAGRARLVVVATFRDTEVQDEHPLAHTLTALHRQEGITRLGLTGLDVDDVSRLVSLLADARLDLQVHQSVAHQLVAETAGNPFYVREMIKHLAETGVLADSRAGEALWDPDAAHLPESVLGVVRSRVSRLGRQSVDVLTLAAAIGTQFDVELLRAASGRSEDELITLLSAACSAQLITELSDAVGRYAFRHALVAHTLLQQAGGTRRAVLHQKVALAMERTSHGHATAALAYHWGETGYTADAGRARDYARRAADEAVEALAPGDAARWYERALKLDDLTSSGDPGVRIDLLTKLGVAQRQAGDGNYRQTLLEGAHLARRMRDPSRLARAMVESNRGMFTDFGKVDWEKVDLLEAAIALSDPDDLATRSELHATLANELTYNNDYPTRRSHADEALALARRVGDPILLLRVMNLVFHPIWNPDSLDERVAMTAESVHLAEQVGDPGIRFWAEHRHYINLLQTGRTLDADRCLGEQHALAERLEQPLYRWVDRFSRAARLLFEGQPAEAERMALEAFRYGQESDQPEADTFFRLNMMTVFWQSGRKFDIRLGEDMAADLPGAQSVRGGLALLAADSGSLNKAAQMLDGAVAGRFSDLHPNPGYMTGLVSFAEAAILLRHRPAAELLHEVLRPWGSQVGFDGSTCVGPIVHYVAALTGLLGRYDEAAALFDASVKDCRRVRSPFFEARGMLEWARILIERGDAADRPTADKLLQESISIATEKGYAAVAQRAMGLLQTG